MSSAVATPKTRSKLNLQSNALKSVAIALAVLAALDFTSAILGTLATGADQPPAGAITLLWAIGVLTLVAIVGLWRGWGWVVPLIYVTRALDLLSGLLGLLNGVHDPARLIQGVVKFVLGLAVIVVLIAAQVSSARARR
jgi:hypothetical protein